MPGVPEYRAVEEPGTGRWAPGDPGHGVMEEMGSAGMTEYRIPEEPGPAVSAAELLG